MRFQFTISHVPGKNLIIVNTHLEELPIRVQRFRLRMMRFQFTISNVPGKDLIIVDTLSRAPVADPTSADKCFQDEANAFISAVLQSLPATKERMDELQLRDPVCQQISEYCQSAWPDKTLYLILYSRTSQFQQNLLKRTVC